MTMSIYTCSQWRLCLAAFVHGITYIYLQYGGQAAGDAYLSHGFTAKMRAAIIAEH